MNNQHFDLSIDMIKSKLIFKGYLLNQDKIDSVISQELPEEEYAIKLREYLDEVVMIETKAILRYFQACVNQYEEISNMIETHNLKEGDFYKLINEIGFDLGVTNSIKIYGISKILTLASLSNKQDKPVKTIRTYHNKNNRYIVKRIKHLSKLLKQQDNKDYIELLFAY